MVLRPFGVLEGHICNRYPTDGPRGVQIEPRSRSESDTPGAWSLRSEGVNNK